jgi:predicted nuclease of predicted toxin-antitoxin system
VRFLVDANLSPRVADLLSEAGHDAEHLLAFDLLRVSDDMLFAFAASDERVIVSADVEFGAPLSLGGLAKPSFVVFQSADELRPHEQAASLLESLPSVAEDLDSGAIVTITAGQVRVRALPLDESLPGVGE